MKVLLIQQSMNIATPIFSDFDLVEVVQNPVWKFGSMYVFRRKV